MRPPRLLLVLFFLIFCPIFLTIFSAFSSPRISTSETPAGRTTGLHALFSFNIPSSLFPPSAVISLTDDNSTFFLARPAAFGPLLPGKGLSGKLWVGSGFGEGSLMTGTGGELGCSDIPGWGENNRAKIYDTAGKIVTQKARNSIGGVSGENTILQSRAYLAPPAGSAGQIERRESVASQTPNDGTDDHLHIPLADPADSEERQAPTYPDSLSVKKSSHADIQSLQETAEIEGNIVLLSRGGCGFLEKVMWAQRRGAIAVIVGDDTRGGNLVTMYARGDTSNATIPAIFTSYTTAHLLSSLIPSHSGSVTNPGSKPSHAKSAGQTTMGIPAVAEPTSSLAPISPASTSTVASKDNSASLDSNSNGGFLRALGSLLGLCNKSGNSNRQVDSRRPPSSGEIDWLVPGALETKGSFSSSSQHGKESIRRGRNKAGTTRTSKGSQMSKEDDEIGSEDFIIGVQDWRDPDLIAPKEKTLALPSTTPQGDPKSQKTPTDEEPASPSNMPLGGSITPGSGEYQSVEKLTGHGRDAGMTHNKHGSSASSLVSTSSAKYWFSDHFGWGRKHEQPAQPSKAAAPKQDAVLQDSNPVPSWLDLGKPPVSDHEGLWVTLSPTSVSTSPFFDTLLVLVVSPLLTLTMVYGLLLLRSRMRRRRWRAPKSVVERLPVRTYHTIARTPSTSSSESLRPASPGPVTPSSPLLAHSSRSDRPRLARSRSQTVAGIITNSASLPKEEKIASSQTGSTLWRRNTPWLTTRRRTCPICKGDVVRSMGHSQASDPDDHDEPSGRFQSREQTEQSDTASPVVPIAGIPEAADPDDEQSVGLLSDQPASASQSSWRNFASFSFSALGGDSVWNQARADRNR
ncbi:hypothetical protein N7539_001331 [Penicillium diatomitis]|uniref:PA domain-containing protein n=1 Tax=Penicillium diatomitis TaxID=2819901 RepID=A0A9W9XH93_9EURO|nr:uncharacterized protein N7539_001331 [Penicillium diatomitis]KAJ5492585.1 hypothetical protein N7539_001331 [Penicillium diatomitis]